MHKKIIDGEFFQQLSKTNFENVANGRKGAIAIDFKDITSVPIVRTTTRYENPAFKFDQVHHQIVSKIKNAFKLEFKDINFNNALVELYDNRYRKMGAHSDQELDLKTNSYICLFSCYSGGRGRRKLIVTDKHLGKSEEIRLDHNSVVLFSTSSNRKLKHKIILDEKCGDWIGVTFRMSKSFVDYRTLMLNGKKLTLATDSERHAFYRLKAKENTNSIPVYDTNKTISYTVSKSDLLVPTLN